MAEYQHELGDRLRRVRRQQGLTLQQVEERSHGEWKAVVVGSYERGDRSVSVSKLAKLAAFYGVPISEFLPHETRSGAGSNGSSGVVVDLQELQAANTDDTIEMLRRLTQGIQSRRGDYNGRVLSLRSDDLESLATVLGLGLGELVDNLRLRGLIHEHENA